MSARHRTKWIRSGAYIAEVDVDLVDADTGWSPYLSLDDAFKLDDVRAALRRGDVQEATRHARVLTGTPWHDGADAPVRRRVL